MGKSNVSNEIRVLFEQNELNDLKRFMNKRECLNGSNSVLVYLFYLVQSAGILTTTIAAGYNEKYLVWVGVGLNVIASFINICEKINNSMLKKLMNDIKSIKEGNYVDEGIMVDLEKGDSQNNNMSSTSNEAPTQTSPAKTDELLHELMTHIKTIKQINSPPVSSPPVSSPPIQNESESENKIDRRLKLVNE